MNITITKTNLSFGTLNKRKTTNQIILHHAAAFTCNASTIHQWHKNNRWAGIGYHFVVRKNGTIESGRPEWAVGSHASGSNSNSLGICFEGNFMNENMSSTQKEAGKKLVAYLKSKYGINKVQGHRDVGSTSCPGTHFPFSEIANTTGSSVTNTSAGSVSQTKQDCLGMGDRGADVTKLQTMLISIGFSCGKSGADGVFGNGTDTAVKKFQKAYGLTVDGLAGTKTMTKLKSLYSKSNESTVSSDKAKENNWVSRLQTECNKQGFSKQKVDNISGTNTLNGCPTLKQGASGNITRLLQERLIFLGYSCGKSDADGVFGSGTKAAVIAFQKKYGLTADGIVGRNTWRKLLGM